MIEFFNEKEKWFHCSSCSMSLVTFASTSVLSNGALFALLVVIPIVSLVPLIFACMVSPHSNMVDVE